MSDLISRTEVLSRIDSIINDIMRIGRDSHALHMIQGALLAKKEVTDLPSAQQWIPCSEKLPDKTGSYLVTKRSNAYPVAEAVYIAGSECWTDTYAGKRYRDGYILAWMPLPKPYEVKE